MTPFFVLLAACGPGGDLDGVGLVGDSLVDPFPSFLHVRAGHLSIDPDLVPRGAAQTPLPVERLAWRTGFSPAQVAVVRLPDLDPETLPTWHAAPSDADGVWLFDLDAGVRLPVMAERDAHPDAATAPSLLIRPQQVLTPGHRIGVAITTDVAERPARFDRLARGRSVPGLGTEVADHVVALLDDLDDLGLPADRVALAWDFPVGSGTAPLASALDALDPPGTWGFTNVRTATDGDRVAPFTWRGAEGSFAVQQLLVDDWGLTLDDAGGVVAPGGTADAYLYVHIPDSVKDAPAGTVPVMLFGHGIFSSPERYLDSDSDAEGVQQLADEAGFIVVGTRWRGLWADERLDALAVAADIGQLPMVPDRLVQAQVDFRTLLALVRDTDLLDDPVFLGLSGQSLPDRSGEVGYFGISLGGIEGAVLMGSGAPLSAAVLHVGGCQWATMLERSVHWKPFELFIEEQLTDPWDRQLFYAMTQLYWDPVDPVSWVDGLQGRPVLWQESVGDEQVPNLTTRLLARSVGVPQLAPTVDPVFGMTVREGPLAAGSAAYVQLDPETPLPPDVNRPPDFGEAHGSPRHWAGTRRQVIGFLTPGQEGTVVHACGDAPCAASNQGEE